MTFFKTPADFRKWLKKHHATADELHVGFYKKGSGKPSLTWPQSVDEALCHGWIDGVRRSLGADAYAIRFTPRRPGSTWSAVNIGRVKFLTEQGLMEPAGLQAFAARSEKKSVIYAYEQKSAELDEASLRKLRKNQAAWTFFQAQPAWYRKLVALEDHQRQKGGNQVQAIGETDRGRRPGPAQLTEGPQVTRK